MYIWDMYFLEAKYHLEVQQSLQSYFLQFPRWEKVNVFLYKDFIVQLITLFFLLYERVCVRLYQLSTNGI